MTVGMKGLINPNRKEAEFKRLLLIRKFTPVL